MALNWNLGKIKDWERVTKVDDKLSPITHDIIWHCLFIGLGEITQTNWMEWWMRYKTLNAFDDVQTEFLRMADDVETKRTPLQASDVRAHIGLTTNAFPNMTKTQFYERLHEQAQHYADVPKAEQPPIKYGKRRR
jgi:hypothetical protein